MKAREKFASVILMVISVLYALIAAYLSIVALIYYNKTREDFIEAHLLLLPDKPWFNLLILAGVLAAGFLLATAWRRLDKALNITRKKEEFIVLGILALYLGFLCFLVTRLHLRPICDQLQVIVDARLFKQGNYEEMRGYMNTYQQQFGLVFFEELLMHITEDQRLFQYLNAVLVAGCVYALYHVTDIVFPGRPVRLYAFFAGIAFLPLTIYVNFVYGEVPSVAFTMFALWAVFGGLNRLRDTGKKRYLLLMIPAVLCITVAYLVRESIIIFCIALSVTLVLYALMYGRKKLLVTLAALLMIPCIIFLPMLASKGVKRYYENRSGIRLGAAMPYYGILTMALQESEEGNGFYNSYPLNVFVYVSAGDPEVAKEIYIKDLKYELKEFMANPRKAAEFMHIKAVQQWNEGSFGSIANTRAYPEEMDEFTAKLYGPEYGYKILGYCNRYVFVLYVLMFVYVITKVAEIVKALHTKKEKPGVLDVFFMIYCIGGFLFSLIWEAKPRYVFPYALYSLPLAGAALYRVLQLFRKK